MSAQLAQVFVLQQYGRYEVINFIIITPEPIDQMIVRSAWSYAVRYTARGLDLPDHEAATKLMLKRHPSWKLINSKPITIPVDLSVADNDEPEAPQK